MIVRHLSTFVTNRISADLESRTLLISLTVPMVKIRGNYKVEGNVFVFQISGNGPFQATLNGVTGVGSAAIDPVGPPGNQKLSIKRTNIDFDIASAHVQGIIDFTPRNAILHLGPCEINLAVIKSCEIVPIDRGTLHEVRISGRNYPSSGPIFS